MLFLGQETKAIALHEKFSSKTRFLRPGSVRKLAGVAGDRLSGDRGKEMAMASDRAFTESGRGAPVERRV
ncbi:MULTISPECIES: hypothetical protein [unclassified Microcoleus]|uniref:hypothetical protein n=1 Tax=unclassified Microcoleus TaxID=2642155 RepID=UPI002FCF0113